MAFHQDRQSSPGEQEFSILLTRARQMSQNQQLRLVAALKNDRVQCSAGKQQQQHSDRFHPYPAHLRALKGKFGEDSQGPTRSNCEHEDVTNGSHGILARTARRPMPGMDENMIVELRYLVQKYGLRTILEVVGEGLRHRGYGPYGGSTYGMVAEESSSPPVSPILSPSSLSSDGFCISPMTSIKRTPSPEQGRKSQDRRKPFYSAENYITCSYCKKNFEENLEGYKCPHCFQGNICGKCLKLWFLAASHDESAMPPKCCSIIPSYTVSSLLTAQQMEFYEAKYAEAVTPNRFRCPNPTCSTFIPSSQQKSQLDAQQWWRGARTTLGTRSTYGTKGRPMNGSSKEEGDMGSDEPGVFLSESFNPSQNTKGKGKSVPLQQAAKANSNIVCLKCQTAICVECHYHAHIGPCKRDMGSESNFKFEQVDSDEEEIPRCPYCDAVKVKFEGKWYFQCFCVSKL